MPRAAFIPDLTARQVANCLGVSETDFLRMRPELEGKRRFPTPDPTTGRYDPEAFERWRRLRNAHLFPELTTRPEARHAGEINVAERLAARGCRK